MTAIQKIEALTAALRKTGETNIATLQTTLDSITSSHTAFGDFTKLIHAEGNYFPSLHKAPEKYRKSEMVTLGGAPLRKITREQQYAELDLLALAYDMAQEARGDSRRAFRS